MLELAQKAGFDPWKCGVLIAGLVGALSDGDLETARPWLREMMKNLNAGGPGYDFSIHWAIVWEAMIRDDTTRAASYQPEMLRLGLNDGWPVHNAVAHLLSVQLLHARGEEQEARVHLENAFVIARTSRSPYLEFMARLTEAQLCFDDGYEAEGLRALSRAMELGRAGGFVNSFVWQPNIMAKLCAKALEHGIEVEYVQSLIRKRKLVPEESPVDIEAWPWPIKIYTLGQFLVLKDDRPLSFSHKVQRKPLALLKVIIAFGGKNVREDLLIDTLWPEADGDAAKFALTSAIHRLRKLLGHDEAIIRIDNEISLDDRYCWVDAWAIERLLARAEAVARGNGDEHSWDKAIQLVQKATDLYKGPFLGNDSEAPWAATFADRVRRRLLRQLTVLGQQWERKQQWQRAADLYEEALRVDPCAEDACRRLMTAYDHLGRPAEVISAYRHCKEALANRLGVNPSVESELLLKNLHPNVAREAIFGR